MYELIIIIICGMFVYLVALNIRYYLWIGNQFDLARIHRMVSEARNEYLLQTQREHMAALTHDQDHDRRGEEQ